jgi:signal peptidase I
VSGRSDSLRDHAEVVLLAVLFALFAKTFVVEALEVPTGSMEKTLLSGDRIFVNKFVYGKHDAPWARLLPHREPRHGDVVIFRSPEDPGIDFVKRFVGLPGDRLEIVRKVLWRDGAAVAEPYVQHVDPEVYTGELLPESLRGRDELGPYTVPAGRYFAMGDNRDDSRDSRSWGTVPRGHVKGRAVLIYASIEPGRRRGAGRGDGFRGALREALDLPERVRWRRTFTVVR